MRIIKLLLIITIYCGYGSVACGTAIIRDSEIEETINKIAAPIMKAAKLQNTRIYLLQDDSMNAFATAGNQIYIFSGLITSMPNIDVLRGVIAHEAGHITGGHIERYDENLDNSTKIAASSIVLGLAGILTGAGALAIAAPEFGMHIADRSIMAHSRAFESSADQAALKYLEQSHNTAKGMIDFFESMHKQNRGAFINPYDQTHPLSNERMAVIRNFYQKSKFKTSQNSTELEYQFARSSAKLLAFTTTKPGELLSRISAAANAGNINNEISTYIKAICYFRSGDLKDAISNIDKLIALRPEDPFYHELKGQILFGFGKKEAIDSYNMAARLRPNDSLILLSKAIVGINANADSAEKMQPFFNDLKLVSAKDPENLLPFYYMAIYYEKSGQKSEALLNSAVIALKTGNIRQARALAREASKGLQPNSPAWFKANDIIEQSGR